MSFWIIFHGLSFFLTYLAFATVFSLHKATVYSVCIFGVDLAAHGLLPYWGAYKERTMGRQWLIWSIGVIIGFVLQQTMLKKLIVYYAPEVITYFVINPQERVSTETLLLILMVYWSTVMFLTMRVVVSKQRIQQRVTSIMVVPDNNTSSEWSHKYGNLPKGSLKLGEDNDNLTIALADITHVTVEDHYCRINYSIGNGLKSQMVRLPLKKLRQKLPTEHFLHIHRSHVVNMGHITRLAKNGRDRKVVLQHFDVELPISRTRFIEMLPRLRSIGIRASY